MITKDPAFKNITESVPDILYDGYVPIERMFQQMLPTSWGIRHWDYVSGSLVTLLIARHRLNSAEPENSEEREALIATNVIIKFAATDALVTLAIDGFLIAGILKEKSILIVPWLMVSGVTLVIYVVPMVSLATLDLIHLEIVQSISLLVATFVSYFVKVIVTVVVYKYYHELALEGK